MGKGAGDIWVKRLGREQHAPNVNFFDTWFRVGRRKVFRSEGESIICLVQDFSYCATAIVHFFFAQGRMNQKHQTRFAEFPGCPHWFRRLQASALKGFFKVNFTATAAEAGNALGVDGTHYQVPVQTRTEENIVLIV
jgi:hypothetical protein